MVTHAPISEVQLFVAHHLHTFRDALPEADIPIDEVKALDGWARKRCPRCVWLWITYRDICTGNRVEARNLEDRAARPQRKRQLPQVFLCRRGVNPARLRDERGLGPPR